MCDRGVEVDHSTLSRWVQKYAPELDKRCRPHLKSTNDSWRVDETYIKVKERTGICIGLWILKAIPWTFYLQRSQDAQAAKRFFRKALQATHTQEPRVINVEKNAAYPKAIDQMKAKEELSKSVELTQNKYLNNQVEQEHRFIKRLTKPRM